MTWDFFHTKDKSCSQIKELVTERWNFFLKPEHNSGFREKTNSVWKVQTRINVYSSCTIFMLLEHILKSNNFLHLLAILQIKKVHCSIWKCLLSTTWWQPKIFQRRKKPNSPNFSTFILRKKLLRSGMTLGKDVCVLGGLNTVRSSTEIHDVISGSNCPSVRNSLSEQAFKRRDDKCLFLSCLFLWF